MAHRLPLTLSPAIVLLALLVVWVSLVGDTAGSSGSNLGSYGTSLTPALITGQVTDAGAPQANATVITVAGHSTTTDVDGNYALALDAPGIHWVTASKGSQTKTTPVDASLGATTVLNLALAASVAPTATPTPTPAPPPPAVPASGPTAMLVLAVLLTGGWLWAVTRRRSFGAASVILLLAGVGAVSLVTLPNFAPPPAAAGALNRQSNHERAIADIDFDGVRINTLTGNVVLREPLFAIPSKGFPVQIVLTHNNDSRKVASHFGRGWNLSYNIRYTKNTSGDVTIVWGDGRLDTFVDAGSSFTSPTGVFDTLTEPAAGQILLTTKHGLQYHFDATHQKLTSIVDPNGNTLTLTYDGSNRLTTVTDAGSRTYTFTYDSSGRLSSVTDQALSRTYTIAYDTSDRLVSITDPLGNATVYAYGGPSKLITGITDKLGKTTTINYGTPSWSPTTRLGVLVSKAGSAVSLTYSSIAATTVVTDPNGGQTQYAYTGAGAISSITDAQSNGETFTWDAAFNLVSSTDRRGNTTTMTHDAKGNLLTKTDALSNVTTLTYEPTFNRISSLTDPRSNTWVNTFDTSGNLLTNTDPVGETRSDTFDSSGQVTSSTDRNGNTTLFAYNGTGDLTGATDPLGGSSAFVYDGASRLTSLTDPNGHVTGFTHDALGRLITTTNAVAGVRTFAFDAEGRLLSVTDEAGSTTSYAYDDLGRQILRTDPLLNTTSSSYDLGGNITALTNLNGNTTTFTYDSLFRLTAVTDATGNADARTHDANGNLTSITNRRGYVTSATYDDVDRLSTVTDAVGNSDARTYDGNSNLTSYTDANGSVWGTTFDAVNRVIARTNALNETWQYSYDPSSNLINQTDAALLVATFSYDNNHRLIGESFADGNTSAFTYDSDGNMLTALDDSSSYTYTYDPFHRVLQTTDNLVSKSTSQTYDTVGRILTQTGPEGAVTTYGHDNAGRLATILDPAGTTTLTHDAFGNVLTDARPNGVTSTFTYDERELQESISHAGSSGVIQSFNYTRDANGFITKTTRDNGETINYLRDIIDQVSAENGGLSGDPADYLRTYGTDGTGNLTFRYISDQFGARSTTLTLDAAGRHVSDAVYEGATATHTLDAKGNRVRSDLSTGPSVLLWTYDAKNRPITFDDGAGGTETYTHDVWNQRIRYENSSGVNIRYISSSIPGVIAGEDANNDGTFETTWTLKPDDGRGSALPHALYAPGGSTQVHEGGDLGGTRFSLGTSASQSVWGSASEYGYGSRSTGQPDYTTTTTLSADLIGWAFGDRSNSISNTVATADVFGDIWDPRTASTLATGGLAGNSFAPDWNAADYIKRSAAEIPRGDGEFSAGDHVRRTANQTPCGAGDFNAADHIFDKHFGQNDGCFEDGHSHQGDTPFYWFPVRTGPPPDPNEVPGAETNTSVVSFFPDPDIYFDGHKPKPHAPLPDHVLDGLRLPAANDSPSTRAGVGPGTTIDPEIQQQLDSYLQQSNTLGYYDQRAYVDQPWNSRDSYQGFGPR
jgi:YD repeat-containing protein